MKTKSTTTNKWDGATWLTRRYYEALGYHVAEVERFIPPSTRLDAWGFADFLCMKVDRPGIVAVNACGEHEVNAHIAKFRVLVTAWDYLLANPDNKIVVVGWKRGQRLGDEPYCVHLKLSHFKYVAGDCGGYRPRRRNCRLCKVKFVPFACDRLRHGQLCMCTRVDYWGRSNAIFDRCPQCHLIVPRDLFNN